MKKSIGSYPLVRVRVRVRGGAAGAVSQAGGVLLVETVRKTGLDTAISAALVPWRKARAVRPGQGPAGPGCGGGTGRGLPVRHRPAAGRARPFRSVASDPTVSPLIEILAAAGPRALTAIRRAGAEVREWVWGLAGAIAPDANGQVIVDIDGMLVLAHSDKQDATATWKKPYGHHPLTAFVDHGPDGTGEPVAALLRPGNAGTTVSGSAARIQLRWLSVFTPRSAATEATVTPGRERYNTTASALNSGG